MSVNALQSLSQTSSALGLPCHSETFGYYMRLEVAFKETGQGAHTHYHWQDTSGGGQQLQVLQGSYHLYGPLTLKKMVRKVSSAPLCTLASSLPGIGTTWCVHISTSELISDSGTDQFALPSQFLTQCPSNCTTAHCAAHLQTVCIYGLYIESYMYIVFNDW